MNRVSRRAWALLALMILLVGGLGFFLVEYVQNAPDWVTYPGSPHTQGSSQLGAVVDRQGKTLMTLGGGTTYAEDAQVRKAMLHWLGDREGKIYAPLVASYMDEMSRYNMITGLYSFEQKEGAIALTVSAEIQAAALKAMGDKQGVVAVYNYKTGEILCAVTTPNYDPNDPPDITDEELETNEAYDGLYWNRVTRSTYIPGSIFKVATAAAALEQIEDIQEQTFQCTGRMEYGPDAVTCENAHGKVDLKKALAKSCNCAFAQIAQQLGADALEAYVEELQITDSLSFDGLTTREGHFDLSDAADVQVAWAAIGQYTDQVNPAAYMAFMGAIANGGVGVEPYLVSQVTRGEDTVYQAKTTKSDRIMSKETAQILQELMQNNVETVYGKKNFPGLTVCAKSGTSQVGGGKTSNALFAGFVADAEYPLAFIVVVENGGYGSSTCVPILSKVLKACQTVMDAS